MTMSRRDLIKLAVIGGAAASTPARADGVHLRVRETDADEQDAEVLQPAVRHAPRCSHRRARSTSTCPDGMRRPYARVRHRPDVRRRRDHARLQDAGLRLQRPRAGPTIRVHHDRTRSWSTRPTCCTCRRRRRTRTAAVPSKYSGDPLARSTSTHLHGSASLPQYDGYASDITIPGQMKRYFYPNCQEARTLWYHDHGVHHTVAERLQRASPAMYILHDERRAGAGHPDADADAAGAAVRRAADRRGRDVRRPTASLVYDDNSESGVYGDVILVNGVPWPVMEVEPRKYRFRILNASVSRSYRWQLHDGRAPVPMTRHRHRRRPDARAAGRHELPARHGRALRGGHRLLALRAGRARSR